MFLFAIVGSVAKSQEVAYALFVISSLLLGSGTAIMYPNVIAAAAQNSEPQYRSTTIGIYRFWRDSGYWVGGLILGFIAESISI